MPLADLNVDPTADPGVVNQDHEAKRLDPFAQPYNPNLHVGDLADENGEEYAVLVSALRQYSSANFLPLLKRHAS